MTYATACEQQVPAHDAIAESKNCIVVFSRYPQPGETKTRLIPSLGSDGASRLQEQLTLHTLGKIRQFQRTNGCDLDVRFHGGTAEQMRAMFGESLAYRPQQGSCLGEKLANAIESCFARGYERLIVIGSDCPDIGGSHFTRAFESLGNHDVVIGPAMDGGYYLLGLKRPHVQLFHGIDWGGPLVFRQTVAIAKQLGLRVKSLDQLPDVDYPEDLIHCRRVGQPFDSVLPKIRKHTVSVIIPTLNEAARIEQAMRPLLAYRNVEIIVADGGSSDRTAEIAQQTGAKVIRSRPGRGTQMNAGAAVSSGEILLFLHADTRLPEGFPGIAIDVVRKGVGAAAFRLRIDGTSFGLRLVEFAVALRSKWFQRPYGDQGLVVRAETFFGIGGFRNWPLMEDYEIANRLRKTGRIQLLSQSSVTSSRRWDRLGICRNVIYNQFCVCAYKLGVSPERLSTWYRTRTASVKQGSNAATD